jgi:uncharacterized integral membrane protein
MSTIEEKTTEKKLKKEKWVALIFGIVFFLIAIGVIRMGINLISSTNELKEVLTKTEAVVVDCEEDYYYDEDDDIHYTYTVYYEYTVGGEVYKFKRDRGGKRAIGSKSTMYYNPDYPNEMYTESDMTSEVGDGLLSFVLAGLLVLFGVSCIYGSRKAAGKIRNNQQKITV